MSHGFVRLDYCVQSLLSLSSKSIILLERGSKKDDKDNQRKGNAFYAGLTE